MYTVPRHRFVLTLLALLLLCGGTLVAQTYPRIESWRPSLANPDCDMFGPEYYYQIWGYQSSAPWRVKVFRYDGFGNWYDVLMPETDIYPNFGPIDGLYYSPQYVGNIPGRYRLIVYDKNGNPADTMEFIVYRSFHSSQLGVTSTDANCGDNGSIMVSVSDGNPPFQIAITGRPTTTSNSSSKTIGSLPKGTYTVTVTDARGCSHTRTVTIGGVDAALQVSAAASYSLCQGNCATLSISGGTPPYSVSWSDGGFGLTRSRLPQGAYTATVTDANGCTRTATVTAEHENPPAFTLAGQVARVVPCDGSAQGELRVTPTNGTAPITYQWSKDGVPITGDQATNVLLGPGTYTITATDANGCTASTTVELTDPDDDQPLALQLTWQRHFNFKYPGRCWGVVSPEATGGTGPYTFFWPNGRPEGDPWWVSRVYDMPVTIVVTVVDARGCTAQCTLALPNCDFAPTGGDGANDDVKGLVALPNPSNGQFAVDYEPGNTVSVTLQVMNQVGTRVYTNNIGSQSPGVYSTNIDISDQPAGIYYLSLIVDGTPYTEQIQIQ